MVLNELIPMLATKGLDISRVGFIGWSMGGYGALLLGARLGPQRTAGICAVSPALYQSFTGSTRGSSTAPTNDWTRNTVFGLPACRRFRSGWTAATVTASPRPPTNSSPSCSDRRQADSRRADTMSPSASAAARGVSLVGVLSSSGASSPASTIGPSRGTELGRAMPSARFRPDIEGLRAVAVLAVVLFHAGMPGVGGGYIGVDVFFVISGFLITGLLWREVTDAGTVRLGRSQRARARRLLPAAATVGIATSVGAALLLPPLQARTVLGDGIASALYVGNYRFAMQGTDYLAADGPPSPFQHYWSLGVEEQFYLLWPALIIGTAWLIRRITLDHPTQPVPGGARGGRRGLVRAIGGVDPQLATVGVLLAAHPSLGAGRRRSGGVVGRPLATASDGGPPRSPAGAAWA